MAFGDTISQGKNTKATGGGVLNDPDYDVWVRLIGQTETIDYVGAFYGTPASIAGAIQTLYDGNLIGLTIEPYEQE